jgi:hypothetical protein
MLRIILLSVLLLFSFANTAHAQKSKLIVGDWVYGELLLNTKVDEGTREGAGGLLTSMRFSFQADGTFRNTFLGQETSGTWKMDPEATRITLTDADGTTQELRVLDVTATMWLMQLQPGMALKMVHGAYPR